MLRKGEVRHQSGASLTEYTYTGQYSYTGSFGLMYYNARWYDPYLNHMTQPDAIVPDPYNSQDYDRYAYARNNPLRYTDPSGHIGCESGKRCLNNPKVTALGATPSYGNGIIGPPVPDGYYETNHTVYMGGAANVGVNEWQDVPGLPNNDPTFAEAFSGVSDIAEMHTPTGDPTLQVYLTYTTSENNSVNEISISINNDGESDAILLYIQMTEIVLPSTNSCTTTAICQFIPNSSVVISPGQSEVLTICQNCLSDGSTIYSHPFPNNRDKQIEVLMYLKLFVNAGVNGVESIPMPFMHTIPRR